MIVSSSAIRILIGSASSDSRNSPQGGGIAGAGAPSRPAGLSLLESALACSRQPRPEACERGSVVVARRILTGVAVTVVVAVVSLAGAAAADIDAAAVTLRAADLPGAKVTSQKAVKEPGYVSAFERSFTYKTPNGRAGVLAVEAESAVAATAAQVTTDLGKVRRSLANKAARANLIKNLAVNLKVKPSA